MPELVECQSSKANSHNKKKDRGSENVKTDDGLFLGVSAKLAELIEVKESELEKLRRKGIGMDKERGG